MTPISACRCGGEGKGWIRTNNSGDMGSQDLPFEIPCLLLAVEVQPVLVIVKKKQITVKIGVCLVARFGWLSLIG